jgi:hypothetical protein
MIRCLQLLIHIMISYEANLTRLQTLKYLRILADLGLLRMS